MHTALIRSVGLWQFDELGAPQKKRSWISSDLAGAPGHNVSATPPPDYAWGRLGVNARRAGSAIANYPFSVGQHAAPTWVVLECAPAKAQPAAVEHWAVDGYNDSILSLRDAWYTDTAKPMAQLSRHSAISRGFGLPGLAAELRSPVYLGNLAGSEVFVRTFSAIQVQLKHGLALPATNGRDVLVLLSGDQPGLAARVELAAVRSDGIRTLAGHCQRQGDLVATSSAPPWGESLLKACAASAAPLLVSQNDGDAVAELELQAAGASALLALPFPGQDGLMVVLALWLH